MDENFGLAQLIENREGKGQFKNLAEFGRFLGEANPEFRERATQASSEEVANIIQVETGYFASTIIEAINLKDAIQGGSGEIAAVIRIG